MVTHGGSKKLEERQSSAGIRNDHLRDVCEMGPGLCDLNHQQWAEQSSSTECLDSFCTLEFSGGTRRVAGRRKRRGYGISRFMKLEWQCHSQRNNREDSQALSGHTRAKDDTG